MGPRMMRVAPTVTDPAMQNGKTPAEMLLNEMGESGSDVEDVVFQNRNSKTKEEATSNGASSDNTILIIIFALVVVALVVIIVWMLMRQGNDKRDEEEVRRRIMPQQRGPYSYGPNGQMHPSMQQMRQHYPPHPSQVKKSTKQNQKETPEEGEESEESDVEIEIKKPAKTLAEALGTNKKKSTNNKKDKKDKYNKDNPHPNVLRPGSSPNNEEEPRQKQVKFNQSDVDDIINRTNKALGNSGVSENDEDLLKSRNDSESESSDDDE